MSYGVRKSSSSRPHASTRGEKRSGLSVWFRRLLVEPLEDRRLLNGVTIITHGGSPSTPGDTSDWVSAMATGIANRLPDPSNTSIWTIGVTNALYPGSPQVTEVSPDPGSPNRFTENYNGESIIKLDWSDALGRPTTEVASVVADYLLTTRVSGKNWLDAPLHLIGHSRGASLVGALAEELAAAGVWVDQVTYFDAYPIPGDYGWSGNDTFSEAVANNVAFADNYMHRKPYPDYAVPPAGDFLGTHVTGTHEQMLDGLIGGYSAVNGGLYAGHSNMHLWYQGTVQTSDPISDGKVNNFYAGANGWYSGSLPARTTSGFCFSQIAGGARPSNGFSYLLGGTGDRQQVPVTESAWPNIIYLSTDLSNVQVTKGSPFRVGYRYQDYDSSATISFYLDPDENPYNGNEVATDTTSKPQTGASVSSGDQDVHTDNAQAGTTYYVFAKISDGSHTRYAYTTGTVTVVAQQDRARLVSKTIVDNTQMAAGQHFTQAWKLQNTGTTTWTTGITGYTLNRISGDPLQSGQQWLTLSHEVLPNDYYTFSLDLIAPTTPGTYCETWQMYGADPNGGYGTSFGPTVTVQIVVPGTPVNQRPVIGIVTPSGTQSGNVTIRYSLADAESDACGIVVEYSPNGGGAWYEASCGSGGDGTIPLSSSPNGISHKFVWASGDDIVNTNDSNVKFRITPVDAGGAGTAGTTGTFTVQNQPVSPPELRISDASVNEGNIGTSDCTFSVVLSHVASEDVTVQWVAADGTARVGDSDYQSASNTLRIPAGQTSGTITVKVVGDIKYEENEYFIVTLWNPNGATILRGEAAGTILNDDEAPGSPEIAVEGYNDGVGRDIPDGKPNSEWVDGTYFGTVPQNSTPPTRTYTVHNTGTALLTVDTPTLPPGFSIVEPLDGSIPPDGSDDFTVQMSTATVGAVSGIISFRNNDEDGEDGVENPFTFAISGTVTYSGAAATTIVLDVSPSSSIYGQSVTLTAVVGVNPPGSGTPSGGTVTFMVGSTPVGSTTLGSQATAVFTTSALPAGSQVVTAVYSGDGSNFASSTTSIASNLIANTVAGTMDYDYSGDGGLATDASFRRPLGVAVDTNGDIFIADTSNNVVRKVDHSTGIITTIAGLYGTAGYNGDNIQATAASLWVPQAVAVDANRNLLFIADTGNGRIRRLDLSTGIISTVAGTDEQGYNGDNILATTAQLNNPGGIAVDGSGDLFIADTYNQRVRKVSAGIITTVAGTGTYGFNGDGVATQARLAGPVNVVVDSGGHLFIADHYNNRVREVDLLAGTITTIAGNGNQGFSGDNYPAKEASLNWPCGVAIDNSGNLLIADGGNGRIRKVDGLTRTITTIAGGGRKVDENVPAVATSLSPFQIAVDVHGDLLVADCGWNRVRKIATGNTLVSIAPAVLTVTANPETRVYGQGGPSLTASLGGFQNGETLETSGVSGSPNLSTVAVATSPVGSYPITASLGSLAANNYTFTFVNGEIDVTPAPLAASVTVGGRIYDGTVTAAITGRSLSGVVASDEVMLTGGTAVFADKNVGTGKTVTVSGLGLIGAAAGNYTVDTTASTTASIIPASLTASVAIDDKVYDGTVEATIIGRSLSGVAKFDDVTLMGGIATFADKNAASGKAVAAIDLVLVGVDAGNYIANTTATAYAAISPAMLTVTADDKSRTYGDANPQFTASYSGFKNGEILATSGVTGKPGLTSSAGPTTPVGSYTIVATPGTLAAGNYTFDPVNGRLNVTPALLTVTADDKSRAYGQPNPTFTASYGGFKNGETLGTSGVTGNPSLTCTAAPTGPVGSYTIVAERGTLAAGNYTFAQVNGSLSVTPAMLTTNVTIADRVYDGTTAATITDRALSGVIGSDEVSVVGGTALFADKNAGTGKTVTVSGLSLVGTHAGDYMVAPTVIATADIGPASLRATVTIADKVYDGTAVATIMGRSLSGVIGSDVVSLTSGTAVFSDKNIGSGKTVTATGLSLTGADGGNYTANSSATATANITPLGLTVSAAGMNKVYDGTTTGTVTLSDNRVPGDSVVDHYASATFGQKDVGMGLRVSVAGIWISGIDAGNYTLLNTTSTTAADIDPAILTATVKARSKTYDGTTAARVSGSVKGVIKKDKVSLATSAYYIDKNVGQNKMVTGLGLTGSSAANYKLASTSAVTTAKITPSRLTVAAAKQAKTYGQPDPALTYRITRGRLVGGDGFSGELSRVAGENVGTYKIQQGTLSAGSNYAMTFKRSTLKVTKCSTTIVLAPSVSPCVVGQSVTFHVLVIATPPVDAGLVPTEPTGMVQFYIDKKKFGARVPLGQDGTATSIPIAWTKTGSHKITASYLGNSNFITSKSAVLLETVISAGDYSASALTSTVNDTALLGALLRSTTERETSKPRQMNIQAVDFLMGL